MEIYLLWAIGALMIVILLLQFRSRTAKMPDDLVIRLDQMEKNSAQVESAVRDEVKANRQELTDTLAIFRLLPGSI